MALFAVALYVLFIRPTVIANQFVAAVERGDYEAAEALATSADPHFLTKAVEKLTPPHFVEGTLAPQTWHDLFHGRRAIDIYIISSMTKYKVPPFTATHYKGRGCGIKVTVGVTGVFQESVTFRDHHSEHLEDLPQVQNPEFLLKP
jgi:hypothetical protein